MQKKTVFKSLFGIAAAALMSACGSNDLLDNNLQAGTDQPIEGSVSIQNVATCGMSPVADGFGIVCDGSLIGTLKHGSNGKDGSDGKDGNGCSLAELDDGLGYQVSCGDDVGIITNGKDGNNGDGCSMSNVPTGVGMYLVCGDQAVLIKHGENGADGKDGLDGKDGTSCSATAVSNGYALYCGDDLVGVVRHGKDGKDGVDGAKGSSCYAEPYEDENASGFNLFCADSLIGTILNGKNGISVKDTIVLSAQDTLMISSKDTVVVNNKDTLIISNVDTILVKDTLVLSAKDTLTISAKDTVVISKKDTVVVKDTLVKKDTVVVKDTLVVTKKDTTVISKKDTVVVKDTLVKKDTVVINNAVGCNIAKVVGSTVYIACGKDTTEVEANINITNNYNNGSLESTTFDPIIVYVSSSSIQASSSSAQVVVRSSSSLNYTVDIGVVTGTCATFSTSSIYRGDSTDWRLTTSGTSSVDDIMNSIFVWEFPGSIVESYTAKGSSGLTTPKIMYDEVGTFKANVSINGDTKKTCSSVTVKPSLIKNCICNQIDSDRLGFRKWNLSSCESYATIDKYVWTGVESTSEDGLIAYTDENFNGMASVSVSNIDGTEKKISCGTIINSSVKKSFSKGIHYLSFYCSDMLSFIASSEGAGSWITSYNSGKISYEQNGHWCSGCNSGPYNGLDFRAYFRGYPSASEAFGETVLLTVDSGTIQAYCGR